MKNLPGYVRAENDTAIRNAIRESLSKEGSSYLTICEQMRFMYDTIIQIKDEDIKNDLLEKLIDAFNMGKKMNARLAKYKADTNDKTGSAGSHLIKLNHTELRKKLRRERNT